jgi:hypothetical protein
MPVFAELRVEILSRARYHVPREEDSHPKQDHDDLYDPKTVLRTASLGVLDQPIFDSSAAVVHVKSHF